MGRIKKAATERHTATVSPFVSEFVLQATSIPLYQLPAKLDGFPQSWPFPRGDLYHWLALLDRFDHLLQLFNEEYGLNKGPQQVPFECRLLQKGDAEDGMPYPPTDVQQKELEAAGYSPEGDQELIESVLHFTRTLLEHCGNRSLYASSEHLNGLLHTTSLTLLRLCLQLSLRLAQRYQVARYKNNHPHAQALLLASHYNISFDRLQKIAQPFPKPPQAAFMGPNTPTKGKELGSQANYNPSDLVAIAKEPQATAAKADLASVHLTYYEQSAVPSRMPTAHQPSDASPTSPTPVRRTSTLGPSRERPLAGERSVPTTDVSSTPVHSREAEILPSSAPRSYHISSAMVSETPAWDLMKEILSNVPEDEGYDALTRVRVAKAFTRPEMYLQPMLEVRLLAISNLIFALNESQFQERIGTPDSEEPKSFHLAQQLCDLLQPSSKGQEALSMETETTVLSTLEALSKTRQKSGEVSDALQITHNHGVLYYGLRKVITTLSMDENGDRKMEQKEHRWREATFDLVNALLQSNSQARLGERMVAAGIMDILVEALNIRTSRAERFYEKVLQFFDSFIHGITTAFQTLADAKGLDIIADLTSYEVRSSLQSVKDGKGLSPEFKSKVVDYDIPFHRQSVLRQLFKFIVHMFEHNAGTHDRLLRNLIDAPQVLDAFRHVIENAVVFGANVWSGAVNIMSSFIHNEPTSFQVVSEAGLVQSLLQTIVPWDLNDSEKTEFQLEETPISLEYEDGELRYPVPSGILPVGETMCDIPTAFGAICLNEAGMAQFQSSKALLKFMDIFVSPQHVKALEDEGQTAATIGQAFDELSRHHPPLKQQIMFTVIAMVKRVTEVCQYLAERKSVGAKLWERAPVGIAVSGGMEALAGSSSGVRTTENTQTTRASTDDIDEDEEDRVSGLSFISACFKFLEGFFHNTAMCSAFCEQGGAPFLLQLVTSASNPHDLVSFPLFTKISQVLKTMCEAKPHLVLPSLLGNLRRVVHELDPLIESRDSQGVFSTFTDLSKPQISSLQFTNGTTMVKSLTNIQMLTQILGKVFSPPSYTSRQTQPNQLFTILNFTEIYVELVTILGTLHGACLWENFTLQQNLSEKWREQTDPRPFNMRRIDANGDIEVTRESHISENQVNIDTTNASDKDRDSANKEELLAKKNIKTVRCLLTQVPMGIEAFFHSLGQALVPKRSGDASAKQHATLVADRMAEILIWEMDYKKFDSTADLTQSLYTVATIKTATGMLLRYSSSMEAFDSMEALSLVLSRFYLKNGFSKLNDFLGKFGDTIEKEASDNVEVSHREGMIHILRFYSQAVRHKCINDAVQSSILSVRDFRQADYFMPGQLLVEIRDAVLPAVRQLWESTALNGLVDFHTKLVIETLRNIIKGEGEERALKRSDKASRRIMANRPEFKLRNADGLHALQSHNFDVSLTLEALYRCNNHDSNALEYCKLTRVVDNMPRFPIPDSSPPPSALDVSAALLSNNSVEDSTSRTTLQWQTPMETADATGSGAPAEPSLGSLPTGALRAEDPGSFADEIFSDDNLGMPVDLQERDPHTAGDIAHLRNRLNFGGNTNSGGASTAPPSKDTHQPFVTGDDLDDKRKALRNDLIDRCLEVLSEKPTITFELAELIQAAVAKNGEGANPRADIGRTLVSSLLSLQGEEPSKESGAKIASYAHLVALILQDRDFFDSTLDELKEYFDALVSWIQLGQDQKAEDAPWIEMILLIIERVLAEDEQPVEIDWDPPPLDNPLKPLASPRQHEAIVPNELKITLFDALLDLVPKIGKKTSLALSVTRVLVILTRRRQLAIRLSDKQRMQKLFMMIRQLNGSVSDKLQSSFMIILRHLIEDEQTLRHIMKTEIKATFEAHRSSRAMDTTTYTRNLFHLVLRDPEMFVSVTEEMLEAHFDGNPHRAQTLLLKRNEPIGSARSETQDESSAQQHVEPSETDIRKPTDIKPSTTETTNSIIQFLLRELANFKDVEDSPSPVKDQHPSTSNSSSGDVEMGDVHPANGIATGTDKSDKPSFKPEDHPIYIYRCFVMQCLAELLASYNRTKVEFINFSRKPDTQPATPSKPRSGTLNYLLNVLVPLGTLEHRDDIAHKKKLSTSSWAINVLVSLCAKTQERQTPWLANEEDSDLVFVRRFVLEHALRAFKDATSSAEPLDQRYSRLLALSELFHRILTKCDSVGQANTEVSPSRQIGKLMYEKNFVTALTSAIAELDLNFPNTKRAVKYLLGPLNLLTELGVELSQSSDLTSNATGMADEDEISSATSVSDEDDEREQTPDLYRNSTLGMFESTTGHDGNFESDSDGEGDEAEMYDDGYDDEMDYEEDTVPEHGDVVSDEDEEIEAMADDLGGIEGMPEDMDMVEVVVDGTEGDESESEGLSNDDDDISDDDDHDEADFADQLDEITGDDENHSLADHDVEVAWEEDDGADFELEDGQDEDSPHQGPLAHITNVIVGGNGRDHEGHLDGDVIRVEMGEDEFFDHEMDPEDEDDEDEEADFENEVLYEPELEEDEDDEMPLGWGPPPPPVMMRSHHYYHPHHRHFLHGMAGIIGGDTFRPSTFRGSRPMSNARGEDDGTNPLLQRRGASASNNRDRDALSDSPLRRFGRRQTLTRNGDSLIQDIVATFSPNGSGTLNFSADQALFGGLQGALPSVFSIQAGSGQHALLEIDPARPWREPVGLNRWHVTSNFHDSRGSPNTDEAQAVEFRPTATTSRWQEEARMLFGGKHHDKATRIVNTLLRLLVPTAMEAKRLHDKEEAERKLAEENAKEEERKKAEAERLEREAREKKEREEREAKEADERRLREEAEREAIGTEGSSSRDGRVDMEGVEETQPPAEPGETAQRETSEAEQSAQRITTTIRGRELDITNLGIDLDYLEALPEQMREEVIMSQFAEQRSQAAQAGEQPTEISREFLSALPADIQRELLRQEAMDRQRREREEERRRAGQEGNAQPMQAEEMSNADFMATLPSTLRQAILMDADENQLNALPAEIQAEARTLLDRRPAPDRMAGLRPADGTRIHRAQGARGEQTAREASRQRRPVVQMLDKAGVATLLRLMFVSLHHKSKTNLHSILSDVCKNTQSRAEVISMLLSILQDGTADVNAVERSFAQLSLRAKQLSGPKTPQATKRTVTGTTVTPGAELSPLNIVQQCLLTLNALATDNPRVSSFFLTEHETTSSQKAKAAKKGKGRESKASKFPLNALLTLLDRKLITENAGVMETLAALLTRVTHPLTILLKRAKEAQDAAKTAADNEETQKQQEAENPDVQMAEASNSEVASTTAAIAGSSTNASAASDAKAEDPGSADQQAAANGDDKKKHRDLVPPEVPDDNIRLVVNIFAARECPGKTFTDTVDIIRNLSAIPGAKEVFGRELVRQAQELGQAVSQDLADLAAQIAAAQSGTELQGVAIAKFSAGGSKQHKLLRVLVALNYLFDPKRVPSSSTSPDASAAEPKLRENVLTILYDGPTFERLWSNLSLCLAAIRKRGNMVNIAAILLPSIESLMVVCSNIMLKDTVADPTSPQPVGTPSPETRMDSLFFNFTEENRKILNELIRHNPKLMNGNLAVLAKNSKVLEFDNKRSYFTRKLHNRSPEARVSHPTLQLSIRRNEVFMDSYKSLYYKSGNEIKYGKLNIRFHGEEGIDAGGVSREWFAAMARQMFNANYALFNPVASDRTTFHPNALSEVNPEHLMYFKFIGRIIGKALYEGRVLDCHFSRAVYRRILGKSVSLKDMESVDLDYYKSLVWILENDITDITFETFSVDIDKFGVVDTVDLVPNGRNIPVTEDNKQEYVRLVVEHRLIKSVEKQLEQFLSGFHDIIPPELIAIFNEQELELLISGLPEIDLDDWKNNTEYHNYQATSPQIQWFWRAVRSFDKEEKAKLLQFITGTSKVPLNGFKELEGMNGFAKFNIHRDYSSKEKLPSSHTCFNQLDLPEYESYEHLRQQLYTAITAGSEYFGFA